MKSCVGIKKGKFIMGKLHSLQISYITDDFFFFDRLAKLGLETYSRDTMFQESEEMDSCTQHLQ